MFLFFICILFFIRGDMIQQYKIHTGLEKIIFQQEQKSAFYAIPPEIRPTYAAATGYKYKYTITDDRHLPKGLQRGDFYTNRIVNPWNGLDNNTIESKTLNTFKKAIDKRTILP